jgi:hypothetical protein
MDVDRQMARAATVAQGRHVEIHEDAFEDLSHYLEIPSRF